MITILRKDLYNYCLIKQITIWGYSVAWPSHQLGVPREGKDCCSVKWKAGNPCSNHGSPILSSFFKKSLNTSSSLLTP